MISQLLAKNGNKPALKEAEQEEVVLEVIKPLSRMTEELGSLEVDKATEVDAKAMVNSFSKTVTEIETDPGVTLEGGGAEFEEADKLAARLGAKECASF